MGWSYAWCCFHGTCLQSGRNLKLHFSEGIISGLNNFNDICANSGQYAPSVQVGRHMNKIRPSENGILAKRPYNSEYRFNIEA